MAHEHHRFTPGAAITVHGAASASARWSATTCASRYSRRRPELEYDLLLYVASWPALAAGLAGAAEGARPSENLAFVAGVKSHRAGRKRHRLQRRQRGSRLHGDPLAELGEESAVATVELDGEALNAFRRAFPAHLDADGFTSRRDGAMKSPPASTFRRASSSRQTIIRWWLRSTRPSSSSSIHWMRP